MAKFINREPLNFYGKTDMFKIKPDWFNIGKVHFSFVKTNPEGKALYNIDCALSIADALVLCDDIHEGIIPKKIQVEKAKGEKYPKAVWTSTLGGIHEEQAKVRGLRDDGKAVSRFFEISPANSTNAPFLFTAKQGPGVTDKEKGLIKPVGKTEQVVRVPISRDALKAISLQLPIEISAFLAAGYANGSFDYEK